jgi:hypothetical protein
MAEIGESVYDDLGGGLGGRVLAAPFYLLSESSYNHCSDLGLS